MDQVFINPATGEEFEGFAWKKRLKRLVNRVPGNNIAGRVVDPVFSRGNRILDNNRFTRKLLFDGIPVDQFEGFTETDPGYESFLKKAFKRKEGGTFAGNLLRGVAQSAAASLPGGNLLPIGQGLMMKKPAIQAAPAEAVEMAQTPTQAAQVVSAIAPNLSGPALQTAIGAVQRSNSPEDATRTAQNLAALNLAASKEKGKQKTALLIGGSLFGAFLVALIVYLIVRK